MDFPIPARDCFPAKKKSYASAVPKSTIHSLDHDILCSIFSVLDLFDLVRCSSVCKFWHRIVSTSKLMQVLYLKEHSDSFSIASASDKPWKNYLEDLAMARHRLSLEYGDILIDRWKGHSLGIDQCRLKMGSILTGVGDKVVRLWSVEGYKCLEEFSVPDFSPLVDFDFDESKVVGLVGTRICIWKRNGKRSIFPSRKGTFPKGLCMRYIDPEAVVGCEDGTARVFDMYSRMCSRIIRMHAGSLTCLALSDDQLIVSGSSLGSITLSGLSCDQRVATLKTTHFAGIRTLCFNPSSHLLFAGSTVGYAYCWDIRKMKKMWETKVSPNVIYSIQCLKNDKSALVAGGIDGVLRILNQNTGEMISSCIMDDNPLTSSSKGSQRYIERKKGRRLLADAQIDSIPRSFRPPITCLAVGMKKVVTTHNGKYIRVWKFNK